MEAVILAVKDRVPDDQVREHIYADVISVLEDRDADTLEEAKGHDPVYDKLFPEEEEEDWDDQPEDDEYSDDE